MSKRGWIYIASNPAYDASFLKIGMTQKMPEMRLDELRTTGVPRPFSLEYACLVKNAKVVEIKIHRFFAEYRSSTDREFFTVPLSKAVAHIRESYEILHEDCGENLFTEQKDSNLSNAVTTEAPAEKTTGKLARAVGELQKFEDFKPYKPDAGESYMNHEQIEHFRAILLNWRGELVSEVSRTASPMKDEAVNFADPKSRDTQEEEFSLLLRTRDREKSLIIKIDSALDRLQNDDYGYCDACGIEIGVRRLEARPTATMCIDCKTLAEIKERQELSRGQDKNDL